MEVENVCSECGKIIELPYLSCKNFNCTIEICKKSGGVAYQPNGLPIKCIDRNGNMFEHEHGDSKDYKFPVDVEYIGPYDQEEDRDIIAMLWKINLEEITEDIYRKYKSERHALIYTDGRIAITMYECCYAMFYLRDGMIATGSLWSSNMNSNYNKPNYKLNDESLNKIIEFAKNQNEHVSSQVDFFKEQVQNMKSMSCAAKDLPEGWTMVKTEDLNKLGIFIGDDDE